ncbi:hypothetical protein P171DRAFT_439540 [Karstenula rhodostoma CBS 690.94]|uniref:Uncharacterized protein n=1 Tax=Karstenula rhodostoma CBS 690.94 TaxID=1392251 RepID=A0A9P4UIU4_9PLEO|nr:hypothetical protein P171DRAFT_439540 [Karstenula rhodostoma CBS 690.94]
MDPITFSDLDTTDQHLNATGTVECSKFSSACADYNPIIVSALTLGVFFLVVLLVVLFYTVYSHYKMKSARQQHQRRASQILPLYLGSGHDLSAQGTGAGEAIQLRRLSRHVSFPLPTRVQRQRSDTDGGINLEALDGSPRSVGSNDTVIHHDVSRFWVSRRAADNTTVVLCEQASSVGNDGTAVLRALSRSRIPRAPVRSESVDTLPPYEEVEPEGGWQRAQLAGGIGRAI